MSSHRSAFSLVEMSIVLVILGLLIGGVVAGQSLIYSSSLRKVGADYQKFVSAVQLFQGEFNALPGDMTNAQSYWGVAHATAATCVTTASTGTETCNGDGNGVIDVSTGANERFRFWQHLASAGLIAGNFSGVAGGAATNSTVAANSPGSAISNGLWFSSNFGVLSGTSVMDGDFTNALQFGGMRTNNYPITQILRPSDAYYIDMKIDEGKPGTGILRTNWSGCTVAASSAETTADYDLDRTTGACLLYFPRAYGYNS